MKKSIVGGLILLALIVLITPGIVGHLAERSVNRQVEWAVDENRELEITATGFERGWFSSAGRHRVEFAATPAGRELRDVLGFGDAGAGPALIIDTELDHGIVPVASMRREQGSLRPGLGRAESRLSYEAPDGSVTELPGVVYTNIGLSGAVSSRYSAAPGSAGNVTWGVADVKVDSDARAHRLEIDSRLDSIEFRSGDDLFTAGELRFVGDMTDTPHDFYVGDVDVAVGSVARVVSGVQLRFGPMTLHSDSELDDGRVASNFAIDMRVEDMPGVGEVSWQLRGSLGGLDAAALGRVINGLDESRDEDDPALMFSTIERDLKVLIAGGLSADIGQLDVTLPQGTLATDLAVTVDDTDPDTFAWTGLLLSTEARANLRIPAPLFEYIASMYPDARSMIALGFLVRNGDDYELAAEYRQGLLTINGAPMPIPLPSM